MSKSGRIKLLEKRHDDLTDEIDPLLAIENPTPEQQYRIEELDHALDDVIEQIVALEDGESAEEVGQYWIIPTRRYPS